MRKTLITLAILGATAGFAHAQTDVNIYGIVDGGYVWQTGRDLGMAANNESRIGFRGSENLGSDVKVTFELERRFAINTGEATARYNSSDFLSTVPVRDQAARDWQGAANMGLSSHTWGTVRLGRVNNPSIESYRRIDPFNNYSVGASLTAEGNAFYSEQLANTLRYDSPGWSGFSFGLSLTLGQDDHDNVFYQRFGNHGWNMLVQYDRGPLLLLGNFHRPADSDNSTVWNLGAAYQFGNVRVSLGYQDTRVKNAIARWITADTGFGGRFRNRDARQREAIAGLQWDIGPGQLNASFNHAILAHKYSLGYTYNLSRRTALYGVVAYLDAKDSAAGWLYSGGLDNRGAERDSITSVQIGMTHRF